MHAAVRLITFGGVVAAVAGIAAVAAFTAGCKRSSNDSPPSAAATDDAAVESGFSPAPSPSPSGFTQVSGATYQGWISPNTSVDPYIPVHADIEALEANTAASFAAAQGTGEVPPEIDLSTYVRKYNGYRHQGQRFIEVEFICAGSASLAHKHVEVVGGYTCFVHALYNVDDGTLDRWRINPKGL